MKGLGEASSPGKSDMRYNRTESLPKKSPIGKPITRKSAQIRISQLCATEVAHCKASYLQESNLLKVRVMNARVNIEHLAYHVRCRRLSHCRLNIRYPRAFDSDGGEQLIAWSQKTDETENLISLLDEVDKQLEIMEVGIVRRS